MSRAAIAAVLLPSAFLAFLMVMRQRLVVREPVTAPALVAVSVPSVSAALDEIRGIGRIIDGDTLEVAGNRIRLEGIDAPEGAQTCQRSSQVYFCGKEASKALMDFVVNRPVRCVPNGRDQFKRVLAKCFLQGSDVDIGGWMVEQGYAFAFVRYSRKYVALQKAAADAQRGFWSGTFEFPWDYRASLRSQRH